MISKLSAVWLVVLVLSPFTAPFATCDLAHPIRLAGRHQHLGAPLTATTDTNAVLVPARVFSGRPSLVVRVAPLEDLDSAAFVNAALLPHATIPLHQHEARRTILRV